MHIGITVKQHTDNLLSVNDTVKFMFIVQLPMYHYDMCVKVAYMTTSIINEDMMMLIILSLL